MWLELHDGAARHPKVLKLARDLGVSRNMAFGYLCTLWTWVLQMAADGDLSSFDADDIELGIEFEGEAGAFIAAAVKYRLLDEGEHGLFVHDWTEHATHLKAADRKRKEREKKRRQRADDDTKSQDVPGMSPGCHVTGQDKEPMSRGVTLTDRPTDRTDQTDRRTGPQDSAKGPWDHQYEPPPEEDAPIPERRYSAAHVEYWFGTWGCHLNGKTRPLLVALSEADGISGQELSDAKGETEDKIGKLNAAYVLQCVKSGRERKLDTGSGNGRRREAAPGCAADPNVFDEYYNDDGTERTEEQHAAWEAARKGEAT